MSPRSPTTHRSKQHPNSKYDDAATAIPGFGIGPLSRDPAVRLAIYIAMAHAGLALSLALLYGLARLLQEYWRPIQWALLCSMPLRELHTALVSFWSHPLRLGLFETLLAIPLAALRSATASLIDSHAALLRLLGRRPSPSSSSCSPRPVGFSKLMQRLLSFGLFVLLHERVGPLSIPLFSIPGFFAYFAGPRPPPVAAALSAISTARLSRRRMIVPEPPLFSRISRYMTSGLLKHLHTLVGIGLIVLMIFGSVSGFLFFSYKIGIEGKDAVYSLQAHLQENNYSERIGIQRWMEQHNVAELIESCTTKFYESVSDYIDSLAEQYNVTEIVDGFQGYMIKSLDPHNASVIHEDEEKTPHLPFSEKLRDLMLRVRNREWKLIYAESDGVFWEFISVITREDLVEKLKSLALQSIDVSKRVVASSTMVLTVSANILFSVTVSIVSGAAGLLDFLSQLTVFFWLLYYLITAESGGVMDHVLGLLPVSKSTRVRCAEVLDHAVSSVMLATVKVALFQGCFTYLLFRFYRIHFLYVSTFLAWMSAILPITPSWLSSIPAAIQLAVEARYIEAVILTGIHLILFDYGAAVIQHEIPGHNAYLTGLSILGGIALFPSVLEGAIMGPLLMTVMIAVKNLYAEFVLSNAKETNH